MNDIPGLDTLADLFPTKPRSELASRLICSSSMETLIEELFSEQAQAENGRGYSEYVDNLKLMFPAFESCDIAAELQRNNNNIEATIHHFIKFDILGQLSSTMGLPEEKVKPYLTKHNNDFYRASANLVATYRVQKRAWTSRVQDRKSVVMTDLYTFDENKSETEELNQYIWAEESLQQLNYDFLVKSLIFFQGDVFKVLDLARIFIEANMASVTYEHGLGLEARSVPKQNGPTASELLKQTPQEKPFQLPKLGRSSPGTSAIYRNSCAKKRFASAPTFSNLRASSKSATAESAAKAAGETIDLHGYTVAEANSITSAALEAWWGQECEMRVADGLLHQHGAMADFVSPLVIITGRGLHSTDGPKIRSSVLRILKDGKFIVTENVGNVIVYGKKK